MNMQTNRRIRKKQLQDLYAKRNPPRCNVDQGEIVLQTNSDAILATLADEPIHLVRGYDGCLEIVSQGAVDDDIDREDRFYGPQDDLEW